MYTLIAVYVHYFNRSIDLTTNFQTNPYNLASSFCAETDLFNFSAYYLARLA